MPIRKQEAIDALPRIDDKRLKDAVTLTIWPVPGKRCSLNRSVNIAAKKYKLTTKKRIKSLVRGVVPEKHIKHSSKPHKHKHDNGTNQQAKRELSFSEQKWQQATAEAYNHIRDIALT